MKKFILISLLLTNLYSLEITDEGRVILIDDLASKEHYFSIYNFDNWPVPLKIDFIPIKTPSGQVNENIVALKHRSEIIPPKSSVIYPVMLTPTISGDYIYEFRFTQEDNSLIYILPLYFTKK
jgi:hypothetical protein